MKISEIVTVGHFNRANKPILRTTPFQMDVARDNKSQLLVLMPPLDFLRLAAPSREIETFLQQAQNVRAYNRFSKADKILVMPFLQVVVASTNEGRVTGHEGRHRAAAVHNAGGRWMQVAIQLRGGPQYEPEMSREDVRKYGHRRNNSEYYFTKLDLPQVIGNQYDSSVRVLTADWHVENGDFLGPYRR